MTSKLLIIISTAVFLGILAVVSFGFKVEVEPEPQPDFVSKFQSLGCDVVAIGHLHKYSNIFDKDSEEEVIIATIGLPKNLSQEKLDECIKIIQENE